MNIRKFRNWQRRNNKVRKGGIKADSECIREVLNGNTDSLLMAFSWHRSPQGVDYWDAVHDGIRKIGKNGRRFLVLLEKEARYDEWFRRKVKESLADPAPRVSSADVMASVKDRRENRA